MNIAYPSGFDSRGRTAETGRERHIRDLIEQVLFTTPGERVNRPSFGCGLGHLVFEPLSTELASTSQFLVQAALTEWLGDLIQVAGVDVSIDAAALHVSVSYTLRRTQEERTDTFVRTGSAA
jgi:uncharacterized protein